MTTPTQRNGVWVYQANSWFADTTKVNAFISSMLRKGINDVYLSASSAVLADPALPSFINRLSNNGIQTEAVIGNIAWGTANGRGELDAYLQKILDFNARQTNVRRFKSIHLDVEPWIGTGTNTSWVDPLIAAFAHTKSFIAGRVKLSADLAGSKVASLPLSQRLGLSSSLDKVVLMQYETSTANVLSRTNRFMNGLQLTNANCVVIAIRLKDFNAPDAPLAAIQGEFSGSTGFLGWALFQYADMQ